MTGPPAAGGAGPPLPASGPDTPRTPMWERRARRERRWIAIGAAVTTAIAGLDLALGSDVALVGLLMAGPLLTALNARVPGAAAIALYALVLGLLLGIPDGMFATSDHLSRLGTVVVGDGIALAIAIVRHRERVARRRFAMLAETGDVVQEGGEPEEMLQRVAGVCAREVADWAFVFVRGDDGRVHQVAAAHADRERQALAWELLRRYPLDPKRPEGPAAVMSDGHARRYAAVDTDLLASISADEDNLLLLERLGMRSVVVVPLTAHGRTFGAIALATAESGIQLEDEDLRLAEEVADRLAVAVDNARLYGELAATESELRRSRDELQAILDGVADAITAQGPGSHLIFANQAAVETMGFESVDELLATPLDEIVARFDFYDEDGEPFPLEELPGRKALAGDPSPEPALTRYRLRSGGPERWMRVKALPVGGDTGLLAINIMEDVTDERVAADAQRFLAEAGRILTSSLDYDTTLANVARLAVPRIADWCAVDVVEEEGLRPVVVAHSDPAKVAWAQELRDRYPPDPARDEGAYRVLRTGEPELYPEIPDELLEESAIDEEHLRLLKQLGFRSAMAVPLTARGRTLGVLTLVTSDSDRRLDEDDMVLAEELAQRCAMAVDNSRLFRDRAHIARTLQASLLPPELPQPAGLEIAARFRAAGEGFDVGGDFYDVFGTGSGRWAAVIGDVCGKGPEAAALTALARYTLRAAALTEQVPSRILATLNEAMLRQRSDRRFSTVLFASLDHREGGAVAVRFASGGHPLPLVFRAGGAAEEVGTPGTLLGIVPDPDLYDDEVVLQPGDAVVLYTDGVTDAAAPHHVWEPTELAAMVRAHGDDSADAIAGRLLEVALGAGNGVEPRDDIALLVVRVPPAPGG